MSQVTHHPALFGGSRSLPGASCRCCSIPGCPRSCLGSCPLTCPPWKSDPVGATAQARVAAAAARAARAAVLTHPLQPPQPGLPGFVQPYKGEPVRAAPPHRSWLIIKQRQNSVGMKLDLSRACGGWGILHNFRWCLFLCFIVFYWRSLCQGSGKSLCSDDGLI